MCDTAPLFASPWGDAPAQGQVLIAEGVDSRGRIEGRIWALGSGDPPDGRFSTPPRSLVKSIFAAPDSDQPGASGAYAPWFFTRNFSPVGFSCVPPPG